jgi:hypothetical protein
MAAFVRAAQASKISVPAVHNIVAPDPTQDRQAHNALRPLGLSISAGSTATLRPPEPAIVPPAFGNAKPQPRPARAAEMNPLVPAPQPQRPVAAAPSQPRSGNTVHIGTVDIHIAPPSFPHKAAPARVPAAAVSSLARGFLTSIGLRQG